MFRLGFFVVLVYFVGLSVGFELSFCLVCSRLSVGFGISVGLLKHVFGLEFVCVFCCVLIVCFLLFAIVGFGFLSLMVGFASLVI